MRKSFSFLFRFPGLFLMTFIFVGLALFLNKEHLDERWWLVILLGITATVVGNCYLFFVQGEKIGETIKGSAVIGYIVVGLLTILSTMAFIAIQTKTNIDFPSDHALQSALIGSMTAILWWAWFALVWNLFFADRYEKILIPIEQKGSLQQIE